MGSIVSIPTAVSVALITTGIVWGFFQKRGPPPDWAAPSNRAVLPGDIVIPSEPKEKDTKEKKAVDKKSKKKKAVTAQVQSASQTEVEPTVVSFPAVVPGAFDQPETTDAAKPKTKPKPKKKKSKKAKSGAAADDDGQSDSSATAPESSTPLPPRPAAKRKSTPVLENDGPWTRVEPRKRRVEATAADGAAPLERTTSDAGVTTSVTGTSSSVAERTEDEQSADRAPESRRPLAERLLPKPRKTGVEDMVEMPDVPSLARVMRVQPRADEQPAAGFSWADYEDVESRGTADDADGEDEGGWVVKSSRSRPKTTKPTETQQTAPETMTKKQRQNLARHAAEKAAKADAEAQRLATLAQHQRQLEKVRIAEQLAQGKKKQGGGMNAVVDAKGHMVFE